MLHRIPEDLQSSVFGKLAVQILREYHGCVRASLCNSGN